MAQNNTDVKLGDAFSVSFMVFGVSAWTGVSSVPLHIIITVALIQG